MSTTGNKITHNVCERCTQEFHSWPEYHAHRQAKTCSVKYVPLAGQRARPKAEVVASLEKKLGPSIITPKDLSLYDTYLRLEARR